MACRSTWWPADVGPLTSVQTAMRLSQEESMRLNNTVCMVLMALGVPVAMGAGQRVDNDGVAIAIDSARVTQARP